MPIGENIDKNDKIEWLKIRYFRFSAARPGTAAEWAEMAAQAAMSDGQFMSFLPIGEMATKTTKTKVTKFAIFAFVSPPLRPLGRGQTSPLRKEGNKPSTAEWAKKSSESERSQIADFADCEEWLKGKFAKFIGSYQFLVTSCEWDWQWHWHWHSKHWHYGKDGWRWQSEKLALRERRLALNGRRP